MTTGANSGGIFLVSDPSKGVRFDLWPASVEDQKSVNWASIDVIGRSEPIPIYRGSGHQTIRFQVMLSSSVDNTEIGGHSNLGEDKVFREVSFLKSLAYPSAIPGSGLTTTPPPVWVILGEYITHRCVLEGIRVNIDGPWNVAEAPGEEEEGLLILDGRVVHQKIYQPGRTEDHVDYPMTAKVDLEFKVVQFTPLTSEHVAEKGDISRDYITGFGYRHPPRYKYPPSLQRL